MKERNYAIDFIRLFAILGVVAIHVSTAFIDRVTVPFSNYFFFYSFVNQVSRFAVPLFFLISGFLLASKYHSIVSPIDFYKKRLSKVLLPYFVWSLIYFWVIFPNPFADVFKKGFIEKLYFGSASYQLYFIPAIIVLYLLFPFIIYKKNLLLTKRFMIFLTIVTGIILIFTYYNNYNIPLHTPFRIALYNLLPFLTGIYAAIRIPDLNSFIKKNLILLTSGTIITAIIIFTESNYLFLKTTVGEYLRNQWRISVLLYGIFIAPVLYYLYPKYLKKYEKSIFYLSTFALGVFFIHVAILQYILYAVDAYGHFNPLIFALSLLAVIILSFIFSIVFSRIKIVNKFLGLRG